MALYNKKGKVQYLSCNKVKQILIDYEVFKGYKQTFEKNFDCRIELLNYVKKMKNIPHEIRENLPDSFGLSDSSLNKLEKSLDNIPF